MCVWHMIWIYIYVNRVIHSFMTNKLPVKLVKGVSSFQSIYSLWADIWSGHEDVITIHIIPGYTLLWFTLKKGTNIPISHNYYHGPGGYAMGHNALELCWYAFHVFHLTLRKMTVFNNLLSTSHYVSWYLFSFSSLHKSAYLRFLYDHIWRLIDGLIQKRHTYNGNALQLRLICIKLSICNDAVRQFSSSSLMHHPDT